MYFVTIKTVRVRTRSLGARVDYIRNKTRKIVSRKDSDVLNLKKLFYLFLLPSKDNLSKEK